MDDTRRYLLESVDDAAVVQLYADGFAALDTRDKILVWHLYLAAIASTAWWGTSPMPSPSASYPRY